MWAFRYAGHPQPCPLASYHRLLGSCYFIYSCISFWSFPFLVPSHPFLISFCNFVLISFLIFWLLTLSFPCLLLSSSFLLLLIYPCIPFHPPPSDSSLPLSLLIVCLSLSVTLYVLIPPHLLFSDSSLSLPLLMLSLSPSVPCISSDPPPSDSSLPFPLSPFSAGCREAFRWRKERQGLLCR